MALVQSTVTSFRSSSGLWFSNERVNLRFALVSGTRYSACCPPLSARRVSFAMSTRLMACVTIFCPVPGSSYARTSFTTWSRPARSSWFLKVPCDGVMTNSAVATHRRVHQLLHSSFNRIVGQHIEVVVEHLNLDDPDNHHRGQNHCCDEYSAGTRWSPCRVNNPMHHIMKC